MDPFPINGRVFLLDRWHEQLPPTDLIAWLEAQPLYPKVFWREKDSALTRAAVGSLLLLPEIPQLDQAPFDIQFYGGMRFSKNSSHDETWENFPDTCFWLPQIEMVSQGDQTESTTYFLNEPASSEPISLHSATSSPEMPSLLERRDTPSPEGWQEGVNTALKAIASGKLDKLVLARKTSLQFEAPIPVWRVLTHLAEKAKRATLFAFQLSPHLCFLGATPERLFERQGAIFNADAIAATRPRGMNPGEDLKLENELLTSSKEQKEFHIVKDYLSSVLTLFSERIHWEWEDRVIKGSHVRDRIIKGSHVQHLYNRLQATLKNGVLDSDLIRALHPTPALGGYPREEALNLLKQIEPFDRGWYGAPIGIVGNKRTSLYVAIRSALIQGRSMHLFAGTGLIPGSTPECEWEELEQKIRPFTELLQTEAIRHG